MKTKNIRNLWVLFFLLSINLLYAQKYQKTLDISERYYDDGDYQKAYELCDRAINRLKSKSEEDRSTVLLQMYLAKYAEAIGNYPRFETLLNECLENKKILNSKNPLPVGNAYLDAAQLYLNYSHTNKAEKYLDSALQILGVSVSDRGKFSKKFQDRIIPIKILSIKAKIAYDRGHAEKFEAVVPEWLRLQKKLLNNENNEIKYYDEVINDYVTRKLSGVELRRYQNQYAQIMTLRADVWRRKGDYEKTRKYLNEAYTWIDDNLNNREVAFIRNKHVENLMDLDSAKDVTDIRRTMEKNLYRAERILTTVHKDYLRMHQDLIDFYMDFMFIRKRNDELWDYSENAEKYYGYENIQNRNAQRLDNERDFIDYALGGANLNNALKNVTLKLGKWRGKLLFWRKLSDVEQKITTDLSSEIFDDLMELVNNSKDIPLNHVERIRVLKWAYELAVILGGHDEEAKEILRKLLETNKLIYGKNSKGYQEAKMLEAKYYQNYTNQFQKVEEIYQASFYSELSKYLTKDHPKYLIYLEQLSNYYEAVEKYDSVRLKTETAFVLSKKLYGSNHPKYAHFLERKVRFDMLQGNYNDADTLLRSSLKIFEAQRDPDAYALEYAQALQTSANYYVTMGLFEEANKAFTKIQRKYDKIIAGSSAQDELAYLYLKMDELDAAERILSKAVRARSERYGKNSRFLINTYNQYARLKTITGKYGEAEEYITQALDIAEKSFGRNSVRTVESIMILAELYEAKGAYEEAEIELNRGVKILETNYTRNHIQVAIALEKLALVKFFKGDDKKGVEKLLLESEEIIANNLGKNTPIYADALLGLARFYVTQNQLDKAFSQLKIAERIWTGTLGTENNRNTADINILLGDVELRQENFKSAQFFYEKSQKIYKKVLGKTHSEYAKSLSKSAKLYYVSKEYKKSKKYIDKSLELYKADIAEKFPIYTDDEKYKYWSKIKGDFEFYTGLMVEMSKENPEFISHIYNNKLMTKTLLLNASLSRIRKQVESDSLLRIDYEKWQADKREYVKLLGLNSEEQRELGIDLKQMQKDIETLEKDLYSRLNISEKQEEITWNQVRDNLREGEVAIELIRYRHFGKVFTDSVIYAALLIMPEQRLKAPQFIPFEDGNKMEANYLKYYRNNIRFGVKDRKSYKRYWQAIDTLLPDQDNLKIYLSTEGVYNQINLESMLKDKETYLIDKMNIIQVGTTKDLVNLEKKQKAGTYIRPKIQRSHEFVFIGNPVFYHELHDKPEEWVIISNRQITQLPGTQDEIETISNLFNKSDHKPLTLLNLQAHEDSLENIRSPKVIHIATHGFFANDETETSDETVLTDEKTKNNPLLRSGVLLQNAGDLMAEGNVYSYNVAPGILTAYEAKDLNLDGTELAVLSACETGRGDVKVGDGVAGLQRAFLAAGVENFVMTLFKVDDYATNKLMQLMYSKWLETGNLRLSFLEAKRELRKIKQFSKPRYWSPFVMISTGKTK